MELIKLLLKLLYLVLLFVILHLIIKPQVQLSGAKLSVFVLAISVLVMYFTFDPGYNFITKNEIIIQSGKKDKDEDEDKDKDEDTIPEGTNKNNNFTKTKIVNNVHQESSSDYLIDHTHKFIQNKVFGQ